MCIKVRRRCLRYFVGVLIGQPDTEWIFYNMVHRIRRTLSKYCMGAWIHQANDTLNILLHVYQSQVKVFRICSLWINWSAGHYSTLWLKQREPISSVYELPTLIYNINITAGCRIIRNRCDDFLPPHLGPQMNLYYLLVYSQVFHTHRSFSFI